MKFPLLFALVILAAECFALLGGCATAQDPSTDPNVLAIQKSCDSPQSDKTVINGHTYFCMDHDRFYQQLNRLLQQYTKSI